MTSGQDGGNSSFLTLVSEKDKSPLLFVVALMLFATANSDRVRKRTQHYLHFFWDSFQANGQYSSLSESSSFRRINTGHDDSCITLRPSHSDIGNRQRRQEQTQQIQGGNNSNKRKATFGICGVAYVTYNFPVSDPKLVWTESYYKRNKTK